MNTLLLLGHYYYCVGGVGRVIKNYQVLYLNLTQSSVKCYKTRANHQVIACTYSLYLNKGSRYFSLHPFVDCRKGG